MSPDSHDDEDDDDFDSDVVGSLDDLDDDDDDFADDDDDEDLDEDDSDLDTEPQAVAAPVEVEEAGFAEGQGAATPMVSADIPVVSAADREREQAEERLAADANTLFSHWHVDPELAKHPDGFVVANFPKELQTALAHRDKLLEFEGNNATTVARLVADFTVSIDQLINTIHGVKQYWNNLVARGVGTIKGRSVVFTLDDFKEDLRALRAEYPQAFLEGSGASKTLVVETPPIVLHGIEFGSFLIKFKLSKLTEVRRNGFVHNETFTVIATNPRMAPGVSTVTHPHVRANILCLGSSDTVRAIYAALCDGRLFDFVDMMCGILKTYNPDSPHVKLEVWDSVPCASCTSPIARASAVTAACQCGECRKVLCGSCRYKCGACLGLRCVTHTSVCKYCQNRRCNTCIVAGSVDANGRYSTCTRCAALLCTECKQYSPAGLSGGHCARCRERARIAAAAAVPSVATEPVPTVATLPASEAVAAVRAARVVETGFATRPAGIPVVAGPAPAPNPPAPVSPPPSSNLLGAQGDPGLTLDEVSGETGFAPSVRNPATIQNGPRRRVAADVQSWEDFSQGQ